ncbi:hypothetical protein DB30_05212 [Enhygromyxa salina]|uniref:Uncharacterized protein n=2 Tax=Enhygromyxa salina TaxID=215803 RepID=A0A0C1ZDS6_9BACT|nr:hypothetical protein DB30_05212 [Enhygromyxa salina]
MAWVCPACGTGAGSDAETNSETSGDPGDGDTGDGDTGDGDTGDGDTGDGDTGEPMEYPDCGVGGDAAVASSYNNFDDAENPEDPNWVAGYHSVCTVAAVVVDGSQTTIDLDCPDDYHPGLVVTAEPAWAPTIEIGSELDVTFDWMSKWEEYGRSWRLASVEDDTLIAGYFDVYTTYNFQPLGLEVTSGVCEPKGWCEADEGMLPQSQDVALEFSDGGETTTLFAGNWGQVGAYDIWIQAANYNQCNARLDAPPGLYQGLIARQ